ncbi:hypothetical protein EEW87_002010 [Janibacter melonis]|uniref:Uncharacterized protein n=1 Tax=Janibacter melonis TaxID=262209 RepID=A0A5P8FJH6_9MICO|nr:hypothetical protein [Janibacter melonis]QFQ29363.2 hypothetical protein EEW87_002010 [Janibacter melonis]
MDDRRRERITWSVVAAGAGLLLITAYAFPTAALMVMLLVALPGTRGGGRPDRGERRDERRQPPLTSSRLQHDEARWTVMVHRASVVLAL